MRSVLKVLIAGVLLVVVAGAPALAQDSGTYVAGEVTEVDPQAPAVDPSAAGPSVLPATLERDTGSAGSTLPVTGGDLAALAAMGLVLVAAGGAAIVVARSRRPVAA